MHDQFIAQRKEKLSEKYLGRKIMFLPRKLENPQQENISGKIIIHKEKY